MSSILLVAESGCDISSELALKYNIHIVPMHVGFGSETMDDGSFPVEDIVDITRIPENSPRPAAVPRKTS